MEKEVTKLKQLHTNSVDLVRRGANQNAHITLYKSAEEPAEEPAEVPKSLLDSIVKGIQDWWNGDNEILIGEPVDEIAKTTELYQETLYKSLDSIVNDEALDVVAKAEMINTTFDQYYDACAELHAEEIGKAAQEDTEAALSDDSNIDNKDIDNIGKSQRDEEIEGQNFSNYTEEGEEMKIDKSLFSPEELNQYEALIAKAKVDDDEPETDDIPEEGEDKEDEELHPEVKKALAEVEEMKKSFEMKELTEVAKKYAILGKNEDELAGKLYEMKKSSPSAYNDYVSLLDEQITMSEKMGTFSEIGKSAHGTGMPGADTQSKIESIASEIQKADPTLARPEAIMKAWDQHPELIAEYERTYKGGNF